MKDIMHNPVKANYFEYYSDISDFVLTLPFECYLYLYNRLEETVDVIWK